MKEEKRITYQAGITRTPSDFLCKDGELAECINLTTDHEELKPLVQPALTVEIGIQNIMLAYVHSHNNTTRYIMKDASAVWWTLDPASSESGSLHYMMAVDVATLQVQSIGNTLIVSSSTGMGFFLWKGSTYTYLGSNIPDISVEFSLGSFGYLSGTDANPNKYGRVPGMHGEVFYSVGQDEYVGNVWGAEDTEGDRKWDSGYETGKEALIGIVSAQLEWVKEKKRFAFPFWARSAVRLYDGTHINISNPFLLLPTVLNNWHIFAYDSDTDGPKVINGDAGGWWLTAYRPYCAKLMYKTVIQSGVNLSDWEDIISGVDIFVSEEVKSFDMQGGWTIINNCVRPDSSSSILATADACQPQYGMLASMPAFLANDPTTWQTFYQPSLLSEGEMTKRLLDQSVFYKIIELDRNDVQSSTASPVDATSKIDRGVLKNLVNSQTLKNDDYFSRTKMVPQVIKAYNGRLHLADVSRGFFNGFTKFSYTAHSNSQTRTFVVYIRTDDGVRIVKASGGSSAEIGDVWFFYPDPRAFKAEVYVGNFLIYSLSLKEHTRLNGAYYFGHLPNSVTAWSSGTYKLQPTAVTDSELLEGQIMVSEVDNPWVFTALGNITVDRGKILGMATQTVALGQEEHGIHPMIVFSEKGITTLRLNKEGVYERSDDLSREVCINPASIIETDGAVFFASKKGLMMVVGESVTCVSGQMNGRVFDYGISLTPLAGDTDWAQTVSRCADTVTFNQYLQDSRMFMAYDYTDSRIHIISPNHGYEYVYNIGDGTISKSILPVPMTSAVNNYPDYLLNGYTERTVEVEGEQPTVVLDRKIYSFYGKPLEEDLNNGFVMAFLLTRPMKFGGPVSQASLRELVNVGMWNNSAEPKSLVKTEIYLSDDLQHWYNATSRFGAAARYFRLALFLKMKPRERLSGTVITSQERRGNNLRT